MRLEKKKKDIDILFYRYIYHLLDMIGWITWHETFSYNQSENASFYRFNFDFKLPVLYILASISI